MTQNYERKATILVVDDEPAIVRMLVEALNGRERSILTATRGDKAIEIYRENMGQIDLVLLDLQMYPQNGLQLLNELRQIDPRVRVAFMSGSPSEGPVAEMAEAGIVSVFSKPFLSLGELATSLNELIEARA